MTTSTPSDFKTSDVLTLTGIQKAVHAKNLMESVPDIRVALGPGTTDELVDSVIIALSTAEFLGFNMEQALLARLK